jgi:hypothetical protein
VRIKVGAGSSVWHFLKKTATHRQIRRVMMKRRFEKSTSSNLLINASSQSHHLVWQYKQPGTTCCQQISAAEIRARI